MSKTDAKHIELHKLLHLLHVEESDAFSFLEKLSKEEISKLRIRLQENAQYDQEDIWKRLAGVAKFMPNFMNAKVGETVLGPMISANLSHHLPIKHAVAVIGYMSPKYLAKVAEYMIPEKSKELMNSIPVPVLKKVVMELLNDKNYFTIASFVDVMDVKKVIEIANILDDEIDLISISEFVENKVYIAKVVEGFKDERMRKIIMTAYEIKKQDEVLEVFTHLNTNETQRILKIIDTLPTSSKKEILHDFEKRCDK